MVCGVRRRRLIPVLAMAAGVVGCGAARPRPRSESAARPEHPQATAAPSAAPSYGISALAPVGARTAWALAGGEQLRDPSQGVLRTVDGGAHWSDATPAGLARAGRRGEMSGLDVLGARRAWLTAGPVGWSYRSRLALLRTSDGGLRWTRVGATPAGCQVQFVDPRDGWCVSLGGAAGSMFVTIWRTRDGGARWREVARNAPMGAPGRPTRIPFACDKSVRFVGRARGFVSSICAGGEGYVYRSVDGGRTWRRVLSLPAPHGGSGGAQFTPVTGAGRRDAVGLTINRDGRTPGRSVIFASDDGGLRWSRIRPPQPGGVDYIDLVSARAWRLISGRRILSTDDGGRSWTQLTANVDLTRFGDPVFSAPAVGWDLALSRGGHVALHTGDGGRSWQPVRVPGPAARR